MLEPERELTLAESSESAKITADERFRIMGTMNPGGDYGKKEVISSLDIYWEIPSRCYPIYW